MKILKFTLSGETAFFKKPDVNTYYYFSYGSIHKVALLGILGAILGLGGYNKQNKNRYKEKKKSFDEYPEFYEKLKDLEVAIEPKNEKAYINKKIQVFNNSVGYASGEEGGNLIIKEQWLEKPVWNIYLKLEDNDIFKELERRLLNFEFEYILYLGKNDHYANIGNVTIFKNVEKLNSKDVKKINTLFKKSDYKIAEIDPLDYLEEDIEEQWKYEEMLPIGLDSELNQYKKESFVATNSILKNITLENEVYLIDGKVIYFF